MLAQQPIGPPEALWAAFRPDPPRWARKGVCMPVPVVNDALIRALFDIFHLPEGAVVNYATSAPASEGVAVSTRRQQSAPRGGGLHPRLGSV